MLGPLIIAGSHRSGTSMTARYLHACGLFLGDDLLGAAASNPYGHYEDREAIRIHSDIFLSNMTDWTLDRRMSPFVPDGIWRRMEEYLEKRQVGHRLWGFKDPRVCHFLPLWKSLAPDMKTLIIYRDPVECVRSMNRRHAEDFARSNGGRRTRFYWEPDLALKIWSVSNAQLADYAEQHPEGVVVVNHRSLANGFPLSEALNERWGLDLDRRDTREDYDVALGAPANRALRVAERENGRVAREVWERLVRLEQSMPGRSGEAPDAQLRIRHDEDYGKILMENELLQFENAFVRRRLHEVNQVTKRVGDARAAHQKDRRALARKKRELRDARRSYEAIVNSTSWKATAPLRAASRGLRRLLRAIG
jgi:hypothetical protein